MVTTASATAAASRPTPEPSATPGDPAGTGPRTDVLVALAQMAPRLGDLSANVERHLELLRDASAGGADLIVFPELSLTGYFLKDLVTEIAVRIDGPELAALAEASRGIDAVEKKVVEIRRPKARIFGPSVCKRRAPSIILSPVSAPHRRPFQFR